MSRQNANEFATVQVVNMVQRRRWSLAEKLCIAAALDVARSRLAERIGKIPEKRPPPYSKELDSVLLPLLREITDEGGNIGLSSGHGLFQPAFGPDGTATRDPQTGLSDHAPSWPSFDAAYRTAARACP